MSLENADATYKMYTPPTGEDMMQEIVLFYSSVKWSPYEVDTLPLVFWIVLWQVLLLYGRTVDVALRMIEISSFLICSYPFDYVWGSAVY